MTVTLAASYAMAGLGLAILVLSFVQHAARKLNVDVANQQICKLAAANNLPRALKLTQAAPGTYFDAVGAAIQAAIETRPRDRATVAAAIHKAFETAAVVLVLRARKIFERGLFGAMLVAGAVGLAASSASPPMPLFGMAAAAGLSALLVFVQRSYIRDALASVRHEVLPALEAVIAEAVEVASAPPPAPVLSKADKLALAAPPPPAGAVPSLRDGVCPLCKHTEVRTVERAGDARFHTLVCGRCGYAQEFADVDKLTE